MKSKRISGEAPVLTYKHVNEGLQRQEDEETERQRRLLLAEERKKGAEDKKALQETLVTQWKADIAVYENSTLPEWSMVCTAIDIE